MRWLTWFTDLLGDGDFWLCALALTMLALIVWGVSVNEQQQAAARATCQAKGGALVYDQARFVCVQVVR